MLSLHSAFLLLILAFPSFHCAEVVEVDSISIVACVTIEIDGVSSGGCTVYDSLSNETQLTTFTSDLKNSGVSFKEGDNYTVFAPTNQAYYLSASSASPSTFHRRAKQPVSPAVAFNFVERSGTPVDLAYNIATLRTNLTDPQYVNLGPNIPANIVSEPDPSSGYKYIYLTTGLGRRARVPLATGFQFDNGIILPSDDVLTLPMPLDTTLRQTNGTGFLRALEQASLLTAIVNTPQVTAFVPIDGHESFSGLGGGDISAATLRRHIWQGSLGYTPDLVVGKSQTTMDGSRVTVTYDSAAKAYFVGGAKVVKANVITKNGVIHYVDRFIAPPKDAETGGAAGSGSVGAGAGGSVKSSVGARAAEIEVIQAFVLLLLSSLLVGR